MPGHSSFIVALKAVLPESAWAWVISALRQDPLVWASLQEPDFGERAIDSLGARPEAWTPAALAFLALEGNQPAPGAPPEPLLRQRALRAYEALVRQGPSEGIERLTLSQAGLLALSLYERRIASGSWKDLPAGLRQAPPDGALFAGLWDTPLAILYGLAADRLELLRALVFPGSPGVLRDLALHALLSNPLPPTEQGQILAALLREIPKLKIGAFLRQLEKHHPDLAARLARRALNRQQTIPSLRPAADGFEKLDHLGLLLFNADLHALAIQNSQAVALRGLALEQVRRLGAQIAGQLAETSAANGNLEHALKVWQSRTADTEGAGSPAIPPAGLVLALLEAGRPRDALNLIPAAQNNSPLSLLVSAHLAAAAGELDRARAAARNCLKTALQHAVANHPGGPGVAEGESHPAPEKPLPAPDVETGTCELKRILQPLSLIFLDLNLAADAAHAARLALSLDPGDASLLAILAQASRMEDEPFAAVEAAHLAVALDSADPALRRELAASLEASGDWKAALAERTALLESRFAPPTDEPWPAPADLRALAACAIGAGQPERALEACQAALELNAEDGLAHALFGEALAATGQPATALEHFRLATQQAPHHPQPWMELARAQSAAGEHGRAIETLRSAVHAVPGDPAVHLALAEAYVTENSHTQALAVLRRAHELVDLPGRLRTATGSRPQLKGFSPGAPPLDRTLPARIAYLLGRTLHGLGHLAESRQVLEKAYESNPAYPGLAYAFAQVLLDLGETRMALPPLVAAVNAGPQDPAPYLDYARALLAAGTQPEEAVRVLRHALEISPAPAPNSQAGAGLPSGGRLPESSAKSIGNTPLAEPLSTHPDNPIKAGWLPPSGVAHQSAAQALLAEALVASGELEAAQAAYYRALETELADDPAWRARLSLGLGRVALDLDQPETALAALQEAARVDSTNPEIPRALCEAFAALSLPNEALHAARTALQLAPDEVGTLTWFADQALHLGVPAEAAPALTRAVQLAPQRVDILLRLGQIQVESGQVSQALESFRQVLALATSSPAAPGLEPDHLRQAAHYLLELDDTPAAIACLERALAMLPAPTQDLLHDLAAAEQRAGDAQRALETLDRAVQLEPRDPALHLFKADLLLALERPQAAQACLEHALNLHPTDPQIHRRLAVILRERGQLYTAFTHAENMLAALQEIPGSAESLAGRALAADLARAMLMTGRARELLSGSSGVPTAAPEPAQVALGLPARLPVPFDLHPAAFYCLATELALEEEEEVAAAEALTRAFELAPGQPRVLALQARFAHRRGDPDAALQSLQAALESIGERGEQPDGTASPAPTASDLQGVAFAALELAQWEPALYLLRRAAASTPLEPFSHLQTARALVLRAEYQRLCASLDVRMHAPGVTALSEHTYRSFTEALQTTLRCLAAIGLEPESDELPERMKFDPASQLELARWQARGQAVFKSEKGALETLLAFAGLSEDKAAYIAALASGGDLAAIAQMYRASQEGAPDRPEHPQVLAGFALALGSQGRRQEDLGSALAAARAAVDRRPHQPLYHALHARLAHTNGDDAAALAAIQTALSFWPEESRWQALAAQLHLANGEPAAAIQRLTKAVALEPKHLPHYLSLGEAYLQAGDTHHAIRALETAVRVAPQGTEAYLALAYAYIAHQDLAKAATSADSAVSVALDDPAPLLLRAEIALRMNDPRGAQQRAEAAHRLDPNSPAALHLLARAQEKSGRPAEALATLEKAIPLAAEPLPLLLERVRLVEGQNGLEPALGALKELAERYPDEPAVLSRLAKSLSASGQSESAIRAAQRALRRAGLLKPSEAADLYYLLGNLLWQSGQLDAATHHLSEATRLDPAHVEAFLDLGNVQQERRQHALALQSYQKAIAAAPKDPRPYYKAGLVLKASRDYQSAETMLRRAAELAPDDLTIHRQLAALVALNLVHNRRTVALDT